MVASHLGPRAIFGGPLLGDSPVYYIYLDEAGTSEHEPVTIVTGIIVKPDSSWRAAREMVENLLDEFVPAQFREGFVFHAKSIWSDRKYRDAWPLEYRLNLISGIASIPRELKLAISLGKIRRDSGSSGILGLKSYEIHHMMAFGNCLARADKHVRDYGWPGEIATCVAEDVPERRRMLKATLEVHRNHAFSASPEQIRKTLKEEAEGSIIQSNAGKITRIIDTVHFVDKKEAPLLQIADACAFSFRRYLSAQEYGAMLVHSILGCDLVWQDWQGPNSSWCFAFREKNPVKVFWNWAFPKSY